MTKITIKHYYDSSVNCMITDINYVLDKVKVSKTQFKRDKYLYKIERIEVREANNHGKSNNN